MIKLIHEVQVSVYGKKAFVNADNPTFSYLTRKQLPYVEVFAIIGDSTKAWRESIKVSSLSCAEEQIKEVIQFFNDTIHEGEKPRHFVSLYKEDEEVARYKDGDGMSGWLDPDGIFHPCGFGQHIIYALDLSNQDENDSWKGYDSDEVQAYALNQHIPMSNAEQSKGSFISILADLTPEQIKWFDRFFYKLSNVQKSVVSRAAEEQRIELKYHW